VKAWHAAGHPSYDDVWARVHYWGKRGQWKKLKPLKHHLDIHEQKWLDIWQSVKKSPEHSLLSSKAYHISPQVMGWIANDGLRQLARDHIERAWLLLGRIAPQLKSQDVSHLKRYLAVRAAKQHQALATTWLASLPNHLQNKETRAWFVRLLLLDKQWKKALHAMQAMPESEQIQSRWLYWQGYVLEQLQQPKTAQLLFEQAALDRGYYSFLSASHLHQAYQMGAKHLDDMDMTWLLNKPSIQRAYEWFYWGESSKASAEWYLALKGASKQRWAEAMQLAIQWGWHEQVIRAASKSGQWDVLEARFPMAYESEVIQAAKHNQLKASMIWSIIRQESAFNPKAISRTGARGLMQLMPATAKDVVKKHHIRHRGGLNLSRPKHNIELGSLYIADMLKRFDGQQALAIAAYNAGPNRVAKWENAMPLTQEVLWVELIPFNETRRYVQHVLAFMVVYDWLREHRTTSPPM
ncbi:MAG: transglycosylase SLT domain-containing protein, partial [Mariprofundaceae bacterium]|nr:transglycosylase SLT domain-containing protein [Mariprofundaceae bacterium]